MDVIEAKSADMVSSAGTGSPQVVPVTVIVPVRNEARNLPRCLESLRGMGEVYVVDSQSSDDTCAIAESFGAKAIQFHYQGGWPKKRQWAMDTLPIAYDWILLLDADEVVTPELECEIQQRILDPDVVGYHICLQLYFLGRLLRHCDASFWKLSLFRKGQARFECRLKDQDASMADMGIHEHVIADGPTAELRNPSEARRIFQLGGASAVASGGELRRNERLSFRHSGPAPTMAQEKTLSPAGIAGSALSLPLRLSFGIS